MIDKIQDGTECKPCNCPIYTSSSSCPLNNTRRRTSRSLNIHIEEPKSFQAPVIVSFFKQKQLRFRDFTKRGPWRPRRHYECKAEKFNICRWYKRKTALKSLKDQNKKEQDREKKRQREEYERKRINDIILWEYGKEQKAAKEEHRIRKQAERERQRINDIIRADYKKRLKAIKEEEEDEERRKKQAEYEREKINDIIQSEYAKQQKPVTKYEPRLRFEPPTEKKKEIIIKEKKYMPKPWRHFKQKIYFPAHRKETKEKKKTFIKDKSADVKPRAKTKQVSVKKYKQKRSATDRFVTCCYRICCQFYCCLTCILIIAFIIVVVL